MANSAPFDHIVFTEFDDSEGILVAVTPCPQETRDFH